MFPEGARHLLEFGERAPASLVANVQVVIIVHDGRRGRRRRESDGVSAPSQTILYRNALQIFFGET